jgi:Tfp pilus assembly protein PilF
VLSLQDEVAAAIADEVRIKLLPNEKARLASAHAVNPEAHEAYLRGLYHLYKRNPNDLEKSAGYFQQAITLDPRYALAYAGLADAYLLRGSMLYMVLPPREAMPKSKAAALQALQIDDKLPEAWATLAYVETLYEWNWAKAEQDFQRAIALNPSYAKAHLWYSMLLAAMGRHDEAIAESKRAHQLDPLSLITNSNMGLMLFFAGRYDAAVEQFHDVLELDPNFFVPHWQLGLVYEQKRMYEQARSEFQKALALSPGNLSVVETLAEIDALSGRKDDARRVLRDLERRSQHEFVSPYIMACLNVALGDSNEAFRWLEKAYDDRDNYLIFVRVDPALQSLRADRRFLDLTRRMGLGAN